MGTEKQKQKKGTVNSDRLTINETPYIDTVKPASQ